MAKLCLIFICVFLIVQLTLANRVARDAPAVETTTNSALDKVVSDLTKNFQDTFSKDNLDKAWKALSEAGDKLKDFGSDLASKVSEKTSELTKKE